MDKETIGNYITKRVDLIKSLQENEDSWTPPFQLVSKIALLQISTLLEDEIGYGLNLHSDPEPRMEVES